MPLPRSTGVEFLETGSRNPPPQGAKRPGAPPKAAPGEFFEPVSKKISRGGPGEGEFPNCHSSFASAATVSQDIPCYPGITRDITGYPRTSWEILDIL